MDGVDVYPHFEAFPAALDAEDANATSPSSLHAHALTTASAGSGGTLSGTFSRFSVHTSRIAPNHCTLAPALCLPLGWEAWS